MTETRLAEAIERMKAMQEERGWTTEELVQWMRSAHEYLTGQLFGGNDCE